MEQKKTVLIVEDEKNIVDIIRFNLQRTGYNTLEAYDGEAGLAMAREEKPDLILLDVMMPKMDGIELCQRVKSNIQTSHTPFILLTARTSDESKMEGYEAGADSYISKPFSPKILVARVNAILRRANVLGGGDEIDAGGIVIDKAAHQVKIDDKEIELSFKEFELLTYFVENQGIALSREKILNNVWDYDYFGDARTIDTHVKKLRSKLGEKGNYIKTIWGMGYKFEVDEE